MMRQLQKILSLLLCAALLLSLCACGPSGSETSEPTTTPDTQGTTAPSTEPTTEPATEPTLSLEEVAGLYTAAVEAAQALYAMTWQVSVSEEIRIGEDLYTSSYEQTYTYSGLGTDSFLAAVEDKTLCGDYEIEIQETYADGKVYAQINHDCFSQEMTAEDFQARYTPLQVFDPAIYGAAEVTGEETETTLLFSLPSAVESWLAPGADVVDATGTVKLDAAGALTQCVYTAEYTYGGNHFNYSLEVNYGAPAVEPAAPEDPDSYALLESIDPILMMEQTYGYLLQSKQLSSNSLESTFTQAAGFLSNVQANIYTHGEGFQHMIKVEQSVYQMDYTSNQDFKLEFEETFRNGKYHSITDDGEPVLNSTVTRDVMVTYYQGMLVEDLPELANIASAKTTHLGSLYLAECTLTEEYADLLRGTICTDIFGNPSLLDDLASAYQTNKAEFYLSVDCYTGLPVAMGIQFECAHTIDGQKYLLTYQVDNSFDLGSLEAYKAITEDPAPDTEPEEKATPLFYHVTGENGQEMWLFGTIHVGDDRTGFLPAEIYDAFAASDALAVECDTESFDEQYEDDEELQDAVSDAYYYSDGTTAKDHIEDEELYDYALQMLKASGNYNMNSLYLKPYMWGNAVDNFFLRQGHQLTGDKGVEERLMRLAEEQEKPVYEVESTLFQIQMMTGYSDKLQETLLGESVSGSGQASWEGTWELYSLWCAGKEAEMIEYLKDDTSEMTEEEKELYDEYNTAMSSDRNKGMLEVAKKYLESDEVVFYAVGLAHLLAEDGLVNTLRDAGYTVELVEYK